ncbi:hypothetical protein UF75_5496 [Desulfosporosinus sp. I2]|nr:hypothetical protein UF75_5496 [Desulfosporosinus sp. I2]
MTMILDHKARIFLYPVIYIQKYDQQFFTILDYCSFFLPS